MATAETPSGGPPHPGLRETMGRLTGLAREEKLRTEAEIRKRAVSRRPFSRFVRISLWLIASQIVLLVVLYGSNRKELWLSGKPTVSLLPANSCQAQAYSTYWQIVAYAREHGHPPAKLEDLLGKYFETMPHDPATGKALNYSADGERFELSCAAPSRR